MTSSESSSSLPSPNIFSSALKSSSSLSLRSKSSHSNLFSCLTSSSTFKERLWFSSMPNDNVDVKESVSDKELCQSSTMFLLIFHDTPERNKWWNRITDHMASAYMARKRDSEKSVINGCKNVPDAQSRIKPYVDDCTRDEEAKRHFVKLLIGRRKERTAG